MDSIRVLKVPFNISPSYVCTDDTFLHKMSPAYSKKEIQEKGSEHLFRVLSNFLPKTNSRCCGKIIAVIIP